MSKRFLIDADEVLANFADPACKVISEVLGRPWSLADRPAGMWDMFGGLSKEEYVEVFGVMSTEGWCLALEPYPGTQEAVKRIRELCDEVFVVTSPHPGPYWAFERTVWLRRHFGFESYEVIHAARKYVCSGDFFLDDHPDHVQGWQEQHPEGQAMLWTSEHNRQLKGYDDIRVNSWGEVIERVEHG